MRKLIWVFLLILASAVPTIGQSTQALNPQTLVDEWFRRLNDLDNWFISMDGKEQTDEVVDRMMELYAPDALQFVGPAEDQLGPVMLVGREPIRKWFENFARTYVQVAYRIDVQTAGKEQTAALLYTTPLPWGGLGVSCQITGVYSLRENRRKFMSPGGLFVQFREDGKIQRLRFLVQKDETVEIFK